MESTMEKATPGPWEVVGEHAYILNYCYQQDIVSPGVGFPAKAIGRTQDEAEANARLIASARNLRTALQACVELLGDGPWPDNGNLMGQAVKDLAHAALEGKRNA